MQRFNRVPVFADDRLKASQLDLARGIEQAVQAGANIINISGGQLTDFGEAEGWLENAVNLCKDNNVLIVSAAGNDGCECLHVPAALPTVLAVGAMDDRGKPLDFSNWGQAYQTQGLLAAGENILGAKPGVGTQQLSGTSFAAPIVSGIAALLLSLELQLGENPDPQKIRKILLQSALPCDRDMPLSARRCLAGKLNFSGALTLLTGGNMAEELTSVVDGVEAAGCGCGGGLIESTEVETPETVQPGMQVSSSSGSVESAGNDSGAAGAMNSTAVVESANSNTQQNIVQFSQTSAMPNQTSNLVTASQAPQRISY